MSRCWASMKDFWSAMTTRHRDTLSMSWPRVSVRSREPSRASPGSDGSGMAGAEPWPSSATESSSASWSARAMRWKMATVWRG